MIFLCHFSIKKTLFLIILFYSFNAISQNVNSVIPFKEDSLWGLKDSITSKIIVAPKYQEAMYFVIFHKKNDSFFYTETNILVKLNNKYGFIDKTGKTIFPFIYDYVESYCDEESRRAKVFNGILENEYNTPSEGLYGFINPEGKEVIPLIYKEASTFYNGVSIVKKDSLYGYIDTTGNMITPLIYENATPFCEEGYAHVFKSGKSGVINTRGNEIVACRYDFIKSKNDNIIVEFLYGFFTVMNSDEKDHNFKRGIVNKNGIEIIPTVYNATKPLNEKLIMVADSNWKWGFFNNSGKELIACKYSYVENSLSDNMILVGSGNCDNNSDTESCRYGFVNSEGKEIIPTIYKSTSSFYNGFTYVQNDSLFAYITTNGKLITPFKYDYASPFCNEGFAIVMNDGKYGIIDSAGNEIVHCKYQKIGTNDYSIVIMEYGLFCVETNNKYGIVNKKGIEIIPCIYDLVIPISEKAIIVRINKKWGVRNIDDKELIPLQYDYLGYQFDNMIYTFIGKCNDYGSPETGKYGYINSDGEEIIIPKFDNCKNFSDGLGAVNQNGKWAYIDKTGKIIIDFIFDDVERFENGKAKVIIDNIEKYIEKNGNEVKNYK